MMDDFFIRALIAGTGVALVAGPLGCYVVWRRLAYFGDTLSMHPLVDHLEQYPLLQFYLMFQSFPQLKFCQKQYTDHLESLNLYEQ